MSLCNSSCGPVSGLSDGCDSNYQENQRLYLEYLRKYSNHFDILEDINKVMFMANYQFVAQYLVESKGNGSNVSILFLLYYECNETETRVWFNLCYNDFRVSILYYDRCNNLEVIDPLFKLIIKTNEFYFN